MEEKAKKLGEIRSYLTFGSLAFIVVGIFLALFYGKVTLIPFSYESFTFLLVGAILFGVGLLVLIISQVIINTKLGALRQQKENEEKEKENVKLNKYQKSRKLKEDYRNKHSK